MPHIVKSTILDAPTGAVWNVLRDFNGHDRWHPAVATSTIERGAGRRPRSAASAASSCRTAPELREQLLALSDLEQTFSYCLLDTPIPMFNYVAHVRLLPVTDGDRTLLALGVAVHDADREDAGGSLQMVGEADLSGRLRGDPPAICRRPHERGGDSMPVTVKTFATSGEAAAALSSDRERTLSRRRHAGDARAQRGRYLDLDGRAGDRPRSDAHRRRRLRASRSAPASPLRAILAERELGVSASRRRARSAGRPCATWRTDRRQSVRANAVSAISRSPCWRSTRRVSVQGGYRPARRADRGVSRRRAIAGRRARASRSPASVRPAPTRSAIARSPRIKPKGVSVMTLAAHLPIAAAAASSARASRSARWRRRRFAPRRPSARSKDARSTRRASPPRSPPRRKGLHRSTIARQRLVSARGRRRPSAPPARRPGVRKRHGQDRPAISSQRPRRRRLRRRRRQSRWPPCAIGRRHDAEVRLRPGRMRRLHGADRRRTRTSHA